MTGYGSAQHADGEVSYTVEIRSVNNRYAKLAIRVPDHFQFAETAIERLLRSRIVRGTVNYSLRVRTPVSAAGGAINKAALQHYVNQLGGVQLPEGITATFDLGAAAALPGVCETEEFDEEARSRQLDIIERVTHRALDALIAMRREEGGALARELADICGVIRSHLRKVEDRAPNVVEEYHARLKSRVSSLMQTGGFELESDGLMREVALYAERCDITEELTRLTSHLDQFVDLCRRDDHVGRTLDFLTQELLREANTIASKSNDAVIARSIVEVKGLIDRLREQAQNVE